MTPYLDEIRTRIELANTRATLMSSLGPAPKTERIWPFSRRVVRPLLEPVEIWGYTAGSNNASSAA
jgi:hypothetical protein